MVIVHKSQLSKLFTNHKWQIPHICIYGNCDIYTEGSFCPRSLAQQGRAVAAGVQIRRSEQGRDNMTRVTKGEK